MKKDYRELYEKITKSDWFKKAYHNKSLGECPIVVEELEESDDERIRKALIDLIDVVDDTYLKFYLPIPEPRSKMIAYLEKQKERKPVTVVRIPKFRVGDIIQHTPLEKWDRSARINSIDENGYNIDYTHIGDNVSGGYIGFSFEDEYELVEKEPAEWSEKDKEMLTKVEQIVLKHWNSLSDSFYHKYDDENQDAESCYNWIKSLFERFNLQPEQEYDEKDKQKPVAEEYEIDLGKNGTHIVGVGSQSDIDKMIETEKEK